MQNLTPSLKLPVIPAKAGIQVAYLTDCKPCQPYELDSRLRGNDGASGLQQFSNQV